MTPWQRARDLLPLELPDTQATGMPIICSWSGGKDSTAMRLALKEYEQNAGVMVRTVTAATLWEAPWHEEYVQLCEKAFEARIDVVGKPGGMPDQLANARFPARKQRWCTDELKKRPLLEYHEKVREEHGDTVAAIGIRRDEATTFNTRGTDPEWEWDDEWDGYVWRPILRWTTEDVIMMHRRHGVPMNPAYKKGHNRYGCYPCIYAGKEELRLVAEHAPERIDEIREYERNGKELRIGRNQLAADLGKKPRYKHVQPTFFLTERQGFSGIDKVIEWARTGRGDSLNQTRMFTPPPRGGCMSWGLCEFPEREDLKL